MTRARFSSWAWSSEVVQRERITLEPAFVLHHREYRDTSRILDVFSARDDAVAHVRHSAG